MKQRYSSDGLFTVCGTLLRQVNALCQSPSGRQSNSPFRAASRNALHSAFVKIRVCRSRCFPSRIATWLSENAISTQVLLLQKLLLRQLISDRSVIPCALPKETAHDERCLARDGFTALYRCPVVHTTAAQSRSVMVSSNSDDSLGLNAAVRSRSNVVAYRSTCAGLSR